MSESLVEKKFLYLLLFSLLLHAALVVLLLNLPEGKRAAVSEPFMVDLEDLPTLSPPGAAAPPVQRYAGERQRVARERAPKGDSFTGAPAPFPRQGTFPQAVEPSLPGRFPPPSGQPRSDSRTSAALPLRERSPSDELFRKRGGTQSPEIAALYPGAAKMARLEESYRKKYGPEVAEGETRFLNTDDILFGSFLRRFETAVYGVWRYPAEAAKMGIEGVTPVKITFNHQGEIVATELLQSSGSKILDNEVLRTLKQIGPVGSFPKGYEKETFNLIAFFHYGITQGAIRSLR
jgi:protein TonB